MSFAHYFFLRFVVLVVRLHQQGLRIRLHHLIGFPPSGHRHFSLFQVLPATTNTLSNNN